jgi:hypothetical protein
VNEALIDLLGDLGAAVLVRVAQRPDAVAALVALRDALAAPAAVAADPDALLSKAALAKKLAVSVATVDRLVREGLPVAVHVGDARRFRLEQCRVWCASRGKKPTKARAKKGAADINVDDVLEGAGLVANGGPR